MVRDPFARLKSEYKLLFIGGSSRRNTFKQKPDPKKVISIEKIGSNLVATKTSWFATRLRCLNLNTSCYLLGGSSRRNSFKQKPEPTTVILIEKIGSNLVATKKSWFATCLRGLNLNTSCYLLGVRAAETRSNRNPNQQ